MRSRTRTSLTTRLLVAGVLLLSSAGCQLSEGVKRMTDAMTGKTPIRDAQLMEDVDDADNRRFGVSNLVKRDFARDEPYTTRYRQIAQLDRDHLVRAAAVRAQNVARHHSEEATDN